jgi:hypothetical protein
MQEGIVGGLDSRTYVRCAEYRRRITSGSCMLPNYRLLRRRIVRVHSLAMNSPLILLIFLPSHLPTLISTDHLICHFHNKYTTPVQSVHMKRRNTSFCHTTNTFYHHTHLVTQLFFTSNLTQTLNCLRCSLFGSPSHTHLKLIRNSM